MTSPLDLTPYKDVEALERSLSRSDAPAAPLAPGRGESWSSMSQPPSSPYPGSPSPAHSANAHAGNPGPVKTESPPSHTKRKLNAAAVPLLQAKKSPSQEAVVTGVPDVRDATAPRPKVGQHTLSPEAIRSRARRIFTPRTNGALKVSRDIFAEWHGKGKPRKTLEAIFSQVGYDVDLYLSNEVCKRTFGPEATKKDPNTLNPKMLN